MKIKNLIGSLIIFLICFFPMLIKSSPESGFKVYDVIVIGAGGGGLSAGAKLAKNGMKVLVVEKHSKVGGYMTNFQRGDYTFEVSLHAMDGLDQEGYARAILTELGIINRVKPIKLDPMYRAIFPDMVIDIPADAKAYEELLKKKFPDEAEGIERLFQNMRSIDTAMGALTNLLGGERAKAVKIIFTKPWVFYPVVKYWNKTLSQMLADFIDDQRLLAVFTALSGFAGNEPDQVSAMFFTMMWNSYHFNGYYYFEGGSQSISDALAEVIKENGGEILLNSLVTKILIEDGKAVGVRTEGGEEYLARFVISNANAPDTFFKLVGKENLPEDYIKKLENMKIGTSAFVIYLGVDYDYRDKFPKGVHELMISESYDQHQNFEWYRLGEAEKVSFAIANYSLVSPVAPPGKNVICLTTMMPYNYKGDWYESEGYARYKALKEEVAKVLVQRAEKYLPDLSKHIEVMEVGSPRTMEHFTLNPKGAILGWDNIPEQSMMKRLEQETPIKILYLVGAWTFPGGGQSAVLASGLMCAQKILAQEKKR